MFVSGELGLLLESLACGLVGLVAVLLVWVASRILAKLEEESEGGR